MSDKKKKIQMYSILKSKDKIELKINVKIKLRQILGSINMSLFGKVH